MVGTVALRLCLPASEAGTLWLSQLMGLRNRRPCASLGGGVPAAQPLPPSKTGGDLLENGGHSRAATVSACFGSRHVVAQPADGSAKPPPLRFAGRWSARSAATTALQDRWRSA